VEASYLLPYLFSAADCGGDEGSAKATKTRRIENWQRERPLGSLGDIIREIGFGIFQILPRKYSCGCSSGRAKAIFSTSLRGSRLTIKLWRFYAARLEKRGYTARLFNADHRVKFQRGLTGFPVAASVYNNARSAELTS